MAEVEAVHAALADLWQADPEQAEDPHADVLMINNDGRAAAYYVDRLRLLTGEANTDCMHRPREGDPEDLLEGRHPFQELGLKIWAPEEDTASYYPRLQPMALNVTSASHEGGQPVLTPVIPPGGVDDRVFHDLVGARKGIFLDNLLAIDKATNSTSLVILLEWRGWKLLFPADAEMKSWQLVDQWDQLEEVHFLKVSHHGSHTGMPPPELLDKILPGDSVDATDGRTCYGAVSTAPETYSCVLDEATLDELRQCCRLFSTREDVEDEGYLYVEQGFEGFGDTVRVSKG